MSVTEGLALRPMRLAMRLLMLQLQFGDSSEGGGARGDVSTATQLLGKLSRSTPAVPYRCTFQPHSPEDCAVDNPWLTPGKQR